MRAFETGQKIRHTSSWEVRAALHVSPVHGHCRDSQQDAGWLFYQQDRAVRLLTSGVRKQ
jgi:hypothetical protein